AVLGLVLAFSSSRVGLTAVAGTPVVIKPEANMPEVNPAGADFTINPNPQTSGACGGEDAGTSYQTATGVNWPGGVSNASLPGIDEPVSGSLKVDATFVQDVTFNGPASGVAYGTMTLNSITGATFKGPFNIVTILTDHLTGRGLW